MLDFRTAMFIFFTFFHSWGEMHGHVRTYVYTFLLERCYFPATDNILCRALRGLPQSHERQAARRAVVCMSHSLKASMNSTSLSKFESHIFCKEAAGFCLLAASFARKRAIVDIVNKHCCNLFEIEQTYSFQGMMFLAHLFTELRHVESMKLMQLQQPTQKPGQQTKPSSSKALNLFNITCCDLLLLQFIPKGFWWGEDLRSGLRRRIWPFFASKDLPCRSFWKLNEHVLPL